MTNYLTTGTIDILKKQRTLPKTIFQIKKDGGVRKK